MDNKKEKISHTMTGIQSLFLISKAVIIEKGGAICVLQKNRKNGNRKY